MANARVGSWGMQRPLSRLLVGAIGLGAIMVLTDLAIRTLGLPPGTMASSLIVVAGALISVAAYAGLVRSLEQRRPSELAGEHVLGELAAGLAIGLGLFAATVAVLFAIGDGAIARDAGAAAILPWLLWVVGTSISEELLFRGVMFRILEERLGTWIALAISALMFGGLHAMNQNASAASTLGLAIEAGVLLAAAYVATRRLWLPIALHAGWNFAQLGIFGVVRPGHATHGACASQFTGSPLLTGGDWGPEISVIAVAACLATSALLIARAIRRGRITAPAWRRAR